MSQRALNRNKNISDTILNSDFLKEIDLIRKEYLQNKDKAFIHKKIHDLSDKLRLLDPYWITAIREYIETGVMTTPTQGASIEYRRDIEKDTDALYIKINKHTTQEDITEQWPNVKKMQKYLHEVLADPLLPDHLKIFHKWEEVSRRKKKPQNITRQVAAEIKGSYSESQIRKIVSDLRKQLRAGKKSTK